MINYFVDGLIYGRLKGWAIDFEQPSSPISIKIFRENDLVAEACADLFRADLSANFGTSGFHSFDIVVPYAASATCNLNSRLSDNDELHVFLVESKMPSDIPECTVPVRFCSEAELIRAGNLITLEEKCRFDTDSAFIFVDTSDAPQHDYLNNVPLTKHSLYVGTYKKRYIFGFHHLHAIVSADGEFTCQELTRSEFRIGVHNEFFGSLDSPVPKFKKSEDNDIELDFGRLGSNVRRIEGPVYFGSPIEPDNWGMWLINGIHSAANFVAAGQAGVFLCYAASQWQKDLLRYVGVREDRLFIQEPLVTYYADEVSLLQYSLIDLVVDKSALAVLRTIRERCLEKMPSIAARKIFVSRRSITRRLNGQRELVNEDEVIDVAKRNGFVVVEPELLAFEEQVALFARADVIVGVGGAGMFNVVFAAPGAKVVSLEGTRHFVINHARLFASVDLEFGFFIGKEAAHHRKYPHNPWFIDAERVFDELRSFCA